MSESRQKHADRESHNVKKPSLLQVTGFAQRDILLFIRIVERPF